MIDATFYADRLVWQFRKSGGAGKFAKAFGAHPDEVRTRMVARVGGLREGEVPALACYTRDDCWVLLTTDRLAWVDDEDLTELRTADIADATVDVSALRAGSGKGGMSELTIVTKDGRRYRLRLEPGPPFSGFWNALKTVAASSGSR